MLIRAAASRPRWRALSPGTGAQFSLLPPENATGNWVKVVQRVPVRLQLRGRRIEASAARGHERRCDGRHRPPPPPVRHSAARGPEMHARR